jgi:hypothetical protein
MLIYFNFDKFLRIKFLTDVEETFIVVNYFRFIKLIFDILLHPYKSRNYK